MGLFFPTAQYAPDRRINAGSFRGDAHLHRLADHACLSTDEAFRYRVHFDATDDRPVRVLARTHR